MIAMRVRNKHAIDRTAGLRHDAIEVFRIGGAWIDDDVSLTANQIRIGARTRHVARIVGHEPAHVGRDRVELA